LPTSGLPIAEVKEAQDERAAAIARTMIHSAPETGPAVAMPTPTDATLESSGELLPAVSWHAPDGGHFFSLRRPRPIPKAFKPIFGAIGVFAIALLMFKAPVIIDQINYSFKDHSVIPSGTTGGVVGGGVSDAPVLTIPKINVHAPVNFVPTLDESQVLKSLESGVVHYANTANPGEIGNPVIFGHSSNDWWEPGSFKYVFVLLDKLTPGDQFTVDYQGTRYVYAVTGSQVVDPTNVGVLAQTDTPTFTLITCSPPGTSWRRLVVSAKQISPNPNTAVASTVETKPASNGNLPSAAPGIMTQLSQAWQNVMAGFGALFGGGSKK
jgi:LPXTG-site transpeptidase (sortase) family protein